MLTVVLLGSLLIRVGKRKTRRKNQQGRRDVIPTASSTFPTWSCVYVGSLRSRRAVVLAIGMACTWDLNCHT